MNTMYRCASLTLATAIVAIAAVSAASAQVQRNFPPNTLRGTIVFGDFPEILLNRRQTVLSSGSRVRDENNRIVLPATLNGSKVLVNYTIAIGETQVQDVWILRPDEAAISPWPRTLEEARTWTYDSTTRTWSKP
jgi:hypothetical protein